jgi:hypothetical protein
VGDEDGSNVTSNAPDTLQEYFWGNSSFPPSTKVSANKTTVKYFRTIV